MKILALATAIALDAAIAFAQDRGGTPPTVTPIIERPCYQGILPVTCTPPGYRPAWTPTVPSTPTATTTPTPMPTASPSPVPPPIARQRKAAPIATSTPVPDTPAPTTTPSPRATAPPAPTASPTPPPRAAAGGGGAGWAIGATLLAAAGIAWAVFRKREQPGGLMQ